MKAKRKLSPALNLQIKKLDEDSKFSSSKRLKLFIRFRDKKVIAKLKNIPKVKIVSKMSRLVTASAPVSKILTIAAIKGVEYVDRAQTLKPERGSTNEV